MKTKLYAFFTAAILLATTGCGGASQSAPAAASAPATPATSASTPVAAPAVQSKIDQIKAAGKIVMATNPSFAPYEFEDLTKTGQQSIVGADIELGKAIATALGVELQIEKMDFSTIIGAIQAGKADFAVSGFAYKPERAEQVGMAGPYNSDGKQGLLVPKDKIDQYTTLDSFSGKKIAGQNGAIQPDLVTKYIPGAELLICNNVTDGIMMLKTGKIDALAVTDTVGGEYAKSYADLAMSNVFFDEYKGGMYAICKKEDNDLLALMQKIVTEKDTDGSYETWLTEAKALAQTLQK